MSRDGVAERLDAGVLSLLGKALEPLQREHLLAYLDLLAHWNRTYNLTAITDPAEMVIRHLLDSLAVLPFAGEGCLLDAGTGAGLPGVPLAIMRPDLTVMLLDSTGKKIRFLNHVQRTLSLGNAEPVHARLESCRPGRSVNTVVSRAFATLAEFGAAARGLLGPDSRLLAMKGRLPGAELEALPDWLVVDAIERLAVPGLQADRHLVIMSLRS